MDRRSRRWLRTSAATRLLDLPVVFWIARQVAKSLEALHQAGWMHGDVKPETFWFRPAAMQRSSTWDLPDTKAECSSFADRAVLGTLRYTAPEMLYSAQGGDSRAISTAWA